MRYLRNFGIFAGAWMAAMLVFTIAYGVKNASLAVLYFSVPAIVLGVVGALMTAGEKLYKADRRISWIWIIMLLGLDQAIKIYLFGLDWQTISIPIIDPVFYFDPSHNTAGSYLWVLLGLENVKTLPHVLFVSVLAFLLFEYWRFYTTKRPISFWGKGFVHLFLVGALANVVDNIFHGGSLDYITIRPFYTFDLKDMFITMAELFVLIEVIDQKLYKTSKDIKGFNWQFIKSDVRSWFIKNK
ncbi:MAG TPA: signal peptidase II [Salinivirga sp.]|uniref:signal peptidase II n=1 Tax=Salinivirga sp. TaxID=1970192 RepID=UPI002B49CA9E|nr:signal peptidase II [Salinivirga sp.]HKK58995.1 signal peptidase II [Salinivirga sp.]